ncbi:MAG: zinc-finger domain-containing protein [Rhodobacteraceae bacterium]|nr:zinc-finger domain-containing protein [Paracoccaceae bacterium]
MNDASPEVEHVTTSRVSCVGQGGALGHPKVWYHIPDDRGWVKCGYCDKRFVLRNPHEQTEQEPSGSG